MSPEPLTKTRITGALSRLGELAQDRKLTLEVAHFGGAVFTFVYEAASTTRRADAVARPSALAHELAALVATEQGLAADWLNESVKQFLAPKDEKRRQAGHEFGRGLRVSGPAAGYLLAHKLRACRSPLPGQAGDEGAVRFLLGKIRPKSLTEVVATYGKFFPGEVLGEHATVLVEKTLAELKQPRLG